MEVDSGPLEDYFPLPRGGCPLPMIVVGRVHGTVFGSAKTWHTVSSGSTSKVAWHTLRASSVQQFGPMEDQKKFSTPMGG